MLQLRLGKGKVNERNHRKGVKWEGKGMEGEREREKGKRKIDGKERGKWEGNRKRSNWGYYINETLHWFKLTKKTKKNNYNNQLRVNAT